MYAVIETGGKQYMVLEGDVLRIETIEGKTEGKVEFPVLAAGEGKDLKIGAPLIANAKVVASVVREGRAPKILVYKMKAKKRLRKKQGHRQDFLEVKIDKIQL